MRLGGIIALMQLGPSWRAHGHAEHSPDVSGPVQAAPRAAQGQCLGTHPLTINRVSPVYNSNQDTFESKLEIMLGLFQRGGQEGRLGN